MTPAEKLAIEHEAFECYQFEQGFIHQSTYDKDENGIYLNIRMRDDWKLWQASAKALQSSEPVAECIASGSGHSIGKHGQDGGLACEWCGQEFTHPPASVPKSEYDKLLEAYKSAIHSIDDYDCYDRNTGEPYFKHEIFKWDLEFISEIEAKNEQSINSN